MLAVLERDKRTRVATAACLRKVLPINAARGIRAVQDVAVRKERLERCRIASVTPFAAHIVAAVGRTVPIGQMASRGGIGVGEMTVSTSTLRERWPRTSEYRGQAHANGDTESIHVLTPMSSLHAPLSGELDVLRQDIHIKTDLGPHQS